MKVAIVSASPSQVLVDKMGWVADGFSAAGHSVSRCFTLREVGLADRSQDLLVFDQKSPGSICRNALADMAPRRQSRWVQWYRDAIAYYSGVPLREQPAMSHIRLMRGMDAVLVKESMMLAEYRALGINAHWFDQGCPADMPACEHREKPEWDVLIPGVASYRQRRDDAAALTAAGFKVLWVGLPGGEIPPGCDSIPWVHPVKGLPQVVSRCACVLGVDFRQDLTGFTSDRTWLIAGMGACLVRRESAGMPEVPGFIYGTHEQLTSIVFELTGNAERRRAIGEAARRFVMENHTYTHRANELIALSSTAEKRQCVTC
jgi:hypothetical protein